MAQQSAVPKFGNWESKDNVPYTAYFERARKGRSGGKINRIDSQQNPDTIQASSFKMEPRGARKDRHLSQEEIDLKRSTDSPLRNDYVAQRNGTNVLRAKHEHGGDGHQRRLTDSPMRYNTGGWAAAADSPLHHYGGVSSGDTHKRTLRQNAASDVSVEQSPLHPHSHSKVGCKGNGLSSLSWERKASSEGTHVLAPMTPGRSLLKSATRGDDSLDQSVAVPKFGDWDETNPASADGYTHIFNKVREERQAGAAKVPNLPNETSQSNGQKQYRNEKSKSCCCCFSWGGR